MKKVSIRTQTKAQQRANAVVDQTTGESLNYKKLIDNEETSVIWNHSCANEFERLFQGIKGRIIGTKTFFFIPFHKLPPGRKATYARFVCDIRPQKTETHRTRMTVGGDRINYPGDVDTKTADITTTKILLNCVVSTPNAKFMTLDVKNFYLNTPLKRYEYLRIPINLIPEEVIQQYQLHLITHHGHDYVEIRKGMYGLPQAGLLANQLLESRLALDGY